MSSLSFLDLFIRCAYCDKPISKFQRTIDHIIPVSRGGTEQRENKVWACRACNQKKKNLLPREWLVALQEEQAKAHRKDQKQKLETQIKSLLKYAVK